MAQLKAGSTVDGLLICTEPPWVIIDPIHYQTIPKSTSEIEMLSDLSGILIPGRQLTYRVNGTLRYGMVREALSDELTVNGIALTGNITDLRYSTKRITQIQVIIPGYYEYADSNTLINDFIKSQLVWDGEESYIVFFRLYSDTIDGGANGKATIKINGNDLCLTTDGLTLAAAKTWYKTLVNVNPDYYRIDNDDVIEIAAKRGTNGMAANLTARMCIVTP